MQGTDWKEVIAIEVRGERFFSTSAKFAISKAKKAGAGLHPKFLWQRATFTSCPLSERQGCFVGEDITMPGAFSNAPSDAVITKAMSRGLSQSLGVGGGQKGYRRSRSRTRRRKIFRLPYAALAFRTLDEVMWFVGRIQSCTLLLAHVCALV